MRINKKVLKYIKKNDIGYFRSKNPGILCIKGQHELTIKKKLMGSKHKFQCWESHYNDRWTTFIKDMNAGYQNDNYDSTYDDNDYDHHVELNEAFDYDEISCDPDLKEYWDDTYR
tara:strand:- start:516 stop:860 length:345 start_codon:yes stop_codon:yes gene_type:complete